MKKVNNYARVDPPLASSLDAKSVSMIGRVFMVLIGLGAAGAAIAGIGIFNANVLGVGKGQTGAAGASGVSATVYSLQDIAQELLLLTGNITLIPGPAGANSTVPGPVGTVNLTNAHLIGGGSWMGHPTIDDLSVANDLTVAHNVQVLGSVSAKGLFAGNGTITTTADMYSGTLALQSQSVLSLDTQGGIRAATDIQTTTGVLKTAHASMNNAGVVSGTQITTGTAGATMDSAGVISGTRVTTGTTGATMDSTGLITGTHVTIGSASMDSTGLISGSQVSVANTVTLDSTGLTTTVAKVSGNTITNSLTSNSATIDHADFTNYLRASHVHSLAGILNIADSANTTVLNLGTGDNMNTINYGTGSGATVHNLGGPLDNIYIAGNLVAVNATYVTETNLAVANKTITLNNGGLPGSSGLAGLCIQDPSVNTTICARQALTRDSWQLQSALGPLVVLDQDLQKAASPTFAAVTASSATLGSVTASGQITANGGMTLATTGGTASLLNYYEEYLFTSNISISGGGGIWGGTTPIKISFQIVRFGKIVQITQVASVSGPLASSAYLAAITGLPTRFIPITEVRIGCSMSDNGAYVSGIMEVNAGGFIYFFPHYYLGTFGGGGTATIDGLTISFRTA